MVDQIIVVVEEQVIHLQYHHHKETQEEPLQDPVHRLMEHLEVVEQSLQAQLDLLPQEV